MLPDFLADSWAFFKQHYLALAFIILPIAIPTYVFMHLYGSNLPEVPTFGEVMPFALISMTVFCFWSIAATFYIASVIKGEPLKTSETWRMSFRYLPSYLLLVIFIGLVTAFGLLAFIIPGIIWGIRCAFAQFELLFNRRSVVDSTSASWNKSREHFSTLLGGSFIITLVLALPTIASAIFFGFESEMYETLASFWGPVDAVLRTFYIIFFYRVYDFATSQQELEQKAA